MNELQILALLLRVTSKPADLRSRENVGRVWYTSDRASEHSISTALATLVANLFLLLILMFLFSVLVSVIPWPQVLVASPLGELRLVARALIAHLAVWCFGHALSF